MLGHKCRNILVRKFKREFGDDIYMNNYRNRTGLGEPYVKIDRNDVYKLWIGVNISKHW
jgi:hypothetical protein